MKKLLLYLSTIMLFSTYSVAQVKDRQETTCLKVKSGEEVITYPFNSIEDFGESSEKILDEIAADKKEKNEELTLEIIISVNANRESIIISGSVTANVLTVVNQFKKLRDQLIAIVTNKTRLD